MRKERLLLVFTILLSYKSFAADNVAVKEVGLNTFSLKIEVKDLSEIDNARDRWFKTVNETCENPGLVTRYFETVEFKVVDQDKSVSETAKTLQGEFSCIP